MIKIFIAILLTVILNLKAFANETESLIKGYITNKTYKPIKLKIYEIDRNSLYTLEKNLEDNSYTPILNLKIIAETTDNYFVDFQNSTVFIPEGSRFSGYVNEIQPAKNFNRKGYYKVSFNEVICPNNERFYLKSHVNSKSSSNIYNPLKHVGEATLGFVGGALAGTLLSYQLGGLGLVLATHGYSLAASAGAGGFIGTIIGATQKGSESSIEPGDKILITPLDEISLLDLTHINCRDSGLLDHDRLTKNNKANIKIISIKRKKEFMGEGLIKLKVRITNNSNEEFKLRSLFLKDSQGKEYAPSFLDTTIDIFEDIQPEKTKEISLEFSVEHPDASHWLVLKDRNLQSKIGIWNISEYHDSQEKTKRKAKNSF